MQNFAVNRNLFCLHFAHKAPKVSRECSLYCLSAQSSGMHESFCEADLEKPSLEAGHSFTISLMPACNECPCVYLNLADGVYVNSVLVTPVGLSGWTVTLSYSGSVLLCVFVHVCYCVSSPERLVRICPNIVQQPLAASPLFLFLSPSFPSQGCSVVSASSCQWWTTAGPALTLAGIHETAFLLTETSSTECWVLLSLIVSTLFFILSLSLALSALHTRELHLA